MIGEQGKCRASGFGATVIGTAGPHNLDEVKSLGAIPVRYGDGWPSRVREVASRPVDAVFDASGHGVLPDSVELRGSNERVVTIADLAAFELGLPFSASGQEEWTKEVLEEILGHVRRGLRIAQGAGYPLEEAAAAQEESEKGHPGGKLTIAVS
ncbi:hypothetical protein [Streptomyces scopuliridis]|uniref:hypothetical protein n=1 Tax=Streptomyces scopuliridis TaxID=452529 RepID=UPI003673B209